jgi:hypothetical protein
MAEIERSGFSQLDRLLELVRRTRELLDGVVAAGELPQSGRDFIAERTLPHFEGIQSGFQGWLRSEGIDVAELQYLLRQVAALRVEPPETEADRRAAEAELLAERVLVERGPGNADTARRVVLLAADGWHLAALSHARVVLALLPKLPEEAVRYPGGRRTYADIPTPRGPAELAERLAEIEAQLWRTATGRVVPAIDPAFRRTYGFFDAADRLGLRAFRPAA